MNSKSLIPDGHQIAVYAVDPSQGRNRNQKKIHCVPRSEYELLDAERRRLRQALIDRAIDPNDIPPVSNPVTPDEAEFVTGTIDDPANDVTIEMPKYRCHKVVWALKIRDVGLGPQGLILLYFEDANYPPVHKSAEWEIEKRVESGGYYVVYEDGYASFSPAKAFEEGYTKLP
jgi:hypothetical protein